MDAQTLPKASAAAPSKLICPGTGLNLLRNTHLRQSALTSSSVKEDRQWVIGTPIQYDFLGSIYAGDAIPVGIYGFPQIKRVSAVPKGKIVTFNQLLSLEDPSDYWIHCFCDDYQFDRLWNSLDKYIPYIAKAKGFIGTDYSLYRDYEEERLIWNCYKNRAITCALQRVNPNTIPTAGFGTESTWSWCFDGLPHYSSVAITTNGVLSDPEAQRLFVGGMDVMVNTIHPNVIVICGRYPMWIENKYPNIQIVGIPSYSQQWKARCS